MVSSARLLFQPHGIGSGLYSFLAPLRGHYSVLLTVTNHQEQASFDSEQARVSFDVAPASRLSITLRWDQPNNDQDLHLVHASDSDTLCKMPQDCHWRNRTPAWFPEEAQEQGPNPSFVLDDTNGIGPEIVRIEEPRPGTYRIYVHYFADFSFSGASITRETVLVWIDGIQVGEIERTLTTEKDVWAVADVLWNADGTGTVTPYPSDVMGEIGSVARMQTCQDEGWAFP